MADRHPTEGHRVAIVGGGIAGLATAWHLLKSAGSEALRVTVVEAADRVGGKIHTQELAGVPVEAGPDTFLARVPWASDLCRELGLGDDLIEPATGRAYVWARDRLRPLPSDTVLGVPIAARPLLRSGILSPAGTMRAALDLVLPRSRVHADPSVADIVGARMGREALEVLVEPLVGGINAGRAEGLSLSSTAPQIAMGVDGGRSLVLGLRRHRAGLAAGGSLSADRPLFLGVSGGLERVVHRLQDSLAADVRLNTTVRALVEEPDGEYRLSCAPGPDIVADAIVLAAPAFASAALLRELVPASALELDAIDYASVVVASLAYRPSAVGRDLDGSGFLVPRREGWLTTACTWSTSKWPALRDSGLVILRASAGRAGDDRALALDDDTLATRLHEELSRALGLSEPPTAALVTRWPRSFPQYEPGHAARVQRLEAAITSRLPGVFVTGAAYHGLGIAACVGQGQRTAAKVLDAANALIVAGSRFQKRV